MVRPQHPDLTAAPATEREVGRGSSDALEVEPVATLRGDASREETASPALRVERLRRLALQVRVVTLEEELARAERELQQVRDQYEAVLRRRDADDVCVAGTWTDD